LCVAVCHGQEPPAAAAVSPSSPQRGAPRIHDPSTIFTSARGYHLFSTGMGIESWHSRDLANWHRGAPVFKQPPAWTTNAVPENRGHLWAPDLILLSNKFHLYYSVSSWGKTTSAIGLATNSTLDPDDPHYSWQDAGLVIATGPKDNYNAIDPSVLLDHDGRLWMAFGSYWSGIKLVELSPATGLRVSTNSPVHSLAWNDSIEAAGLYRKDHSYYLFVNWGQCCRGTNSTYEIRVGRSSNIIGPYLDKAGKNLMDRGGTLFLSTEGKRIGPGHAAIFAKDGQEYLGYHYYNAEESGRPFVQVRRLNWDPDGWPAPGDLIEAPTPAKENP
jgi:arabinan endo-1,5-alpha-L-arabinosidase